jgi:hypothetical protein
METLPSEFNPVSQIIIQIFYRFSSGIFILVNLHRLDRHKGQF